MPATAARLTADERMALAWLAGSCRGQAMPRPSVMRGLETAGLVRRARPTAAQLARGRSGRLTLTTRGRAAHEAG